MRHLIALAFLAFLAWGTQQAEGFKAARPYAASVLVVVALMPGKRRNKTQEAREAYAVLRWLWEGRRRGEEPLSDTARSNVFKKAYEEPTP